MSFLRTVRHLVALARTMLGSEVVLYTTDPPPYVANGTLAGDALFSCAPVSMLANPLPSRITQQRRVACMPCRPLEAPCTRSFNRVRVSLELRAGGSARAQHGRLWAGLVQPELRVRAAAGAHECARQARAAQL